MIATNLRRRLDAVFEPRQATVLTEVLTEAYNVVAKASDFIELKGVVHDLAETQKRTEHYIEELAVAQRELVAAQRRTEQRVDELATAQQHTEQRMDELATALTDLAIAQRETRTELTQAISDTRAELTSTRAELTQAISDTRAELTSTRTELTQAISDTRAELTSTRTELTQAINSTRTELGGLSRSVSYALENEAYRELPAFLRAQHGIEISERFIRREIGGEEINVFGHGARNGQQVLIVGEVKLRLDERRGARQAEADALAELNSKIAAVRREYPEATIVPLFVTHYARPTFLQAAREQGVIVVQSFEWG